MIRPSAEDRGRVGRHAPRDWSPAVGHVAEHRRPANERAGVDDRERNDPVVDLGHGPVAVGVVEQEDVTFGDVLVLGRECVKRDDELPDDHVAARIRHAREFVVLLANHR